jgi:hypothetical protein
MCPFEVVHQGFPAISDDGAMLVHAQTLPEARALEDTYIELTWHGPDGVPRLVKISNPKFEVPEVPIEELPEGTDLVDCNDAVIKVRAEVATLNQELSARKWRQLEVPDVVYPEPGGLGPYFFTTMPFDEVIAKLPGADRPVEIFYHAKHFIARIGDLRVLQKTLQPAWWQPPNEFCTSDAQISAMKVDRATRVALVYYNFFNAQSCLCDNREEVGRIELAPEVFAELETRSTEKFKTALELALYEGGL